MNEPASTRLPLIDTAKGVLILLVIWGHLIERAAAGNLSLQMLYGMVYLFHMPAFVFIAGMHSRAAFSRESLRRIVQNLLLPLVVFQALYWPFYPVAMSSLLYTFTTPIWILWFLLSLACWQLILPFFLRLPAPLLCAFALALIAGYIDWIGLAFSLSRSFYFLPAFLLGHLYGRRLVEFAQAHRAVCGAGFVFVLALGLLLARDTAFIPYLYGQDPYTNLPRLAIHPALVRLASIVLGLAATTTLFALLPKAGGGLARIGRQSLPIYLLHGLVVISLWPLLAQSDMGTAASALGAGIAAFAFAWLVSRVATRKA